MKFTSDMERSLAQGIARGDVDPATFLPMADINSGFVPRALKQLGKVSNSPNKLSKAKGKMREPHKSGGILNFFGLYQLVFSTALFSFLALGVLGPNPVIPPRQKQNSPPVVVKPYGLAGKSSGKRTLAEAMDYDMERKKSRLQVSFKCGIWVGWWWEFVAVREVQMVGFMCTLLILVVVGEGD